METVNPSLELSEAIPLVFKYLLGSVHTSTLARVEAYSINPPRARVTPLVNRIINNQVSAYQPIDDVPVCFPFGLRGGLSWPVTRGDLGLLLFTERSLDEVLESGLPSTPVDTRQFHLSDAIFIPGVFKNNLVTKASYADAVELTCGEFRIVLRQNKVAIGVAGFELLDLISQLIQTITTIIPIVGGTPGTLDPASITQLNVLKASIDVIKGAL